MTITVEYEADPAMYCDEGEEVTPEQMAAIDASNITDLYTVAETFGNENAKISFEYVKEKTND